MENENKKEKGKRTFRTLSLIAITVGVCYEIFGRKGQDVKQACNWVKGKIGKKSTPEVEVNSNQRPNNNGKDWNKHRN